MKLSADHLAAVSRRRRIVMHEDGNMPFEALGMPIDEWLALRFENADLPDSQIDAIWWDVGMAEDSYAVVQSDILPPVDVPGLNRWRDQGIDWIAEFVRATRTRGLECFWNHRVCPVDFPQPWGEGRVPHTHPSRQNWLKTRHPDWVVPCWWPQGLWNLANADCRAHKVAVLRELLVRYELDGFQLDFARHTPCLPKGQEWQLRGEVTEFVRAVRTMSLEVEKQTGRPILLAARVPENETGCRADGFDVQAWAEERLVDIFTLGGRTIDLDVAWYRSFTDDTPIRICASFDGHHVTDGYYHPSPAYYRGVHANFWAQGVHTVAVFNWGCASRASYERAGLPLMMPDEGRTESLFEIGEAETLKAKSKVFTLERRGGYPYAGNYHYRNDDRPLPATLEPDIPATFELKVFDSPLAGLDEPDLKLRLILRKTDAPPLAAMNGDELTHALLDGDWKDRQIYGDNAPRNSGPDSRHPQEEQHLLRVEYTVPRTALRVGVNALVLTSETGAELEKAELHVGLPGTKGAP
jgi:hypothetical protein